MIALLHAENRKILLPASPFPAFCGMPNLLFLSFKSLIAVFRLPSSTPVKTTPVRSDQNSQASQSPQRVPNYNQSELRVRNHHQAANNPIACPTNQNAQRFPLANQHQGHPASAHYEFQQKPMGAQQDFSPGLQHGAGPIPEPMIGAPSVNMRNAPHSNANGAVNTSLHPYSVQQPLNTMHPSSVLHRDQPNFPGTGHRPELSSPPVKLAPNKNAKPKQKLNTKGAEHSKKTKNSRAVRPSVEKLTADKATEMTVNGDVVELERSSEEDEEEVTQVEAGAAKAETDTR